MVEGYISRTMHFVYMIKNTYDDLYVGITDNPTKRLRYHNQKRGAEFTKRNSPFEIVFIEEHSTLAEARQREIQLKKWRRDKKETLIVKYVAGLPTHNP